MGGEPAAAATAPPVARAAYHDRARTPAETVACVRPHFGALGITRIARQTGLDRVGIPCFAAIRPNSRSIASNQGKGVDDDAARASAVMEAVEYAIAEAPDAPSLVATSADLLHAGRTPFSPHRALPLGETLPPGQPVRWLCGYALRDRREVIVPLDLVALSGERRDLPNICQHTNGLASGNTVAEAIFHGVCELIERDAGTFFSLLTTAQKQARCIVPESFDDELVLALLARFEAAGLAVRLFDQTSDFGIPTVLAVTAPADGVVVKHFDVATGAGTHPHPARAALRAITEAAQTRVTSIAGARDDIPPGAYRLDGSAEAFALLAAVPVVHMPRVAMPVGSSAEALLAHLLAALAGHGVDDLVAVELGGRDLGVAVVRVCSALLEDRGPNANWRPGRRALRALLGP